MNKWLHKFMEKPDKPDNTDKPDISDKWDGNLENMPGGGPDKPDRLDPSLNLSGLSGRPWGLLEENLRIPEIGTDISDITDKPDKTNSRNYLSSFSTECFANRPFVSPKDTGLLDEYEERLAIAEYDGQQTSAQAKRIAYVDAFVSVLVTLPYDSNKEDWLDQRLNAAQNWLLNQGLVQPK